MVSLLLSSGLRGRSTAWGCWAVPPSSGASEKTYPGGNFKLYLKVRWALTREWGREHPGREANRPPRTFAEAEGCGLVGGGGGRGTVLGHTSALGRVRICCSCSDGWVLFQLWQQVLHVVVAWPPFASRGCHCLCYSSEGVATQNHIACWEVEPGACCEGTSFRGKLPGSHMF